MAIPRSDPEENGSPGIIIENDPDNRRGHAPHRRARPAPPPSSPPRPRQPIILRRNDRDDRINLSEEQQQQLGSDESESLNESHHSHYQLVPEQEQEEEHHQSSPRRVQVLWTTDDTMEELSSLVSPTMDAADFALEESQRQMEEERRLTIARIAAIEAELEECKRIRDRLRLEMQQMMTSNNDE